MPVEIDLSDMRRTHRRAIARLKRTGPTMLKHAASAAQKERDTHSYQNRTHMLENTTVAIMRGNDTVDLMMMMEYASYVNARGFSNIDTVAREAEQKITLEFNKSIDKGYF